MAAAVDSNRNRATTRRAVTTLRPEQDLVLMTINEFPSKLKKTLIRQAERRDSNMTNVAVVELAEHFRVKFVPTDRRFSVQPGDSDDVSFAMPRALRRKISRAAVDADTTKRQIVIDVLNARLRASK